MLSNISLLTYGAAALAFLVLTALLLTQWRVRPLGPVLLLATGASSAWAAIIAAGTLLSYPPVTLFQVAELLRNAAWLFALIQLLGFQEDGDVSRWLGRRWQPRLVIGLAIGGGVIALRPLQDWLPLPVSVSIDAVLLLWLSAAIAGLLLVEQLYRNASMEERWGIKFLCLGLGVLFTYDLFLYAEALLFRQLDAQFWQARGLVNALTVPWLAVAIARNRNWRMDLQVSRHVVFHTVTLMGAGAYLLGMALIGYFIKYLGGNWGGVLQVSFLAASIALLLTLLFSGTLRARVRVLLSKHFFSYRYDYRVEWLRFTEGLAGLGAQAPAGIIRNMGAIVQSPGGLLFHRGSTHALSELARWELDAPQENSLGSVAEWVQQQGWVIDLNEWRQSPDLYAGLELPPWLNLNHNLWLVVPLFFQDELEGLLILARTDLKQSVNWEDRDLLKTTGRQAAALLAQQRASAALLEARQFDAFNRLSAYVVHDLKNILAQQSLMVANARKHRSNPAFVDDMISTVENSVKRMQRLMEQMRSGLRSADSVSIDLGALLQQSIASRGTASPQPTLTVNAAATVSADRERLATVFTHLLQNAQEATPDDGAITMSLDHSPPGHAAVTITDTGSGMSEDFLRNRLFKPFDSTKGLTGMGIGAFESREYVRQLGGEIHVTSRPGEGSVFTVVLPLVEPE